MNKLQQEVRHKARIITPTSGAGRNLKVGTRPERSAGKKFLVVPLHFFAVKVQLVVLVIDFVMVSTIWPVSCLLFLLLTVPPLVPYEVGATDADQMSSE